MRIRPKSRCAKWAVSGVLPLLLWIAPARGAPIVSMGGGVGLENQLGLDVDHVAPLGSMSIRSAVTDTWSAFFRVGYERAEVSIPVVNAACVNCPQALHAEKRAMFVPVVWGVRFATSPFQRGGGFVEAGSLISWARFEEEWVIRLPDGQIIREIDASRHWLVGLEIGAGVHQSLNPHVGLEWAVRYSSSGAPPRTALGESTKERLSHITLTAALTLRP